MSSAHREQGTARDSAPAAPAGVPLDVRIKQWLETTPATTRILTLLMLLVHLYSIVVDDRVQGWAMLCPRTAVASAFGFARRAVTSALTHVNLLHIGMNMSTFMGMGPKIEQKIGSARFAWATLVLMMCSALATAGVSFLFDRPFFYTTLRLGFTRGAFSSCSVGFSGVLFAYWSWLSVRDAAAAWRRGPEGGNAALVALLYPWGALILISLILPNVSWQGHLGGLLSGYLAALWPVSLLFNPPARLVALLEQAGPLASLAGNVAAYVPVATCTDGDGDGLDDGVFGGRDADGVDDLEAQQQRHPGAMGDVNTLAMPAPGAVAPPPGPARVPEGVTVYPENGGDVFDRDVALLESFGYAHARAVEALVASGGNVEAAVALLDAGEL